MSEENVVALKWLIASLETRIIDLEAGRLDESLEELAKNPIPIQYRSLCQELKCIFPSILNHSEHALSTTSISSTPVVTKDDSQSDNLTGMANLIPDAKNSSYNPSLAQIMTASTSNSTSTLSIQTPAITDQSSSSIEHTTRKRKLSVGDDDDSKKVLAYSRSLANDTLESVEQLLPEKMKKAPSQLITNTEINRSYDEVKNIAPGSSGETKLG